MSEIKGIILDINGVIVGEKIGYNSPDPHQDVINKLKAIREAGIPIILCTAKLHFAITSIIEKAKLNNLHITDGGGVAINPIDTVIVEKYTIDNKNEMQRLIQTYLDNNVYIEIYTVDDYKTRGSYSPAKKIDLGEYYEYSKT